MRERIRSVDFVRGLVMVIMALDHVRDFFHYPHMNPTDMSSTTPELFFTRWITHFCAPVFVFLAGTGAFLQTLRGKPTRELSWFLATRGVWLIVLELTLVRTGWTFRPVEYSFIVGQVIWALGCSMIFLSILVYLPTRLIAAFGLIMIFSHNLFDGIKADWSSPLGFLWPIFHSGEMLTPAENVRILPLYPLIPWIGVMATGYAFGTLFSLERAVREKRMMIMGLSAVVLFIVLRSINMYGDASHWQAQRDSVTTVLSFFNCTKYPPSLDYLLMTLGPALILLSRAEAWSGRLSDAFITFGRVPMFYYLMHIPLIHGLSVLFAYLRYGHVDFMFGVPFLNTYPDDFGYSLGIVYAVWLGCVLVLYPACRWYAQVKMKSKNPILSYF